MPNRGQIRPRCESRIHNIPVDKFAAMGKRTACTPKQSWALPVGWPHWYDKIRGVFHRRHMGIGRGTTRGRLPASVPDNLVTHTPLVTLATFRVFSILSSRNRRISHDLQYAPIQPL